MHSMGASVWWCLVRGARHLLFWLEFNLNLCCLTGFCISEGIFFFFYHKSPALLSSMWGCWEWEFNVLLLLEIKLEKFFKSARHLDFSEVILLEKKRSAVWSPHAIFLSCISTNKQTCKQSNGTMAFLLGWGPDRWPPLICASVKKLWQWQAGVLK